MTAWYVPNTPKAPPQHASTTAMPRSNHDKSCLHILSANKQGSITDMELAMKDPMKDMTDAKKGTAIAVSTTAPSSAVRRAMDVTVNFQVLRFTTSSSCRQQYSTQYNSMR